MTEPDSADGASTAAAWRTAVLRKVKFGFLWGALVPVALITIQQVVQGNLGLAAWTVVFYAGYGLVVLLQRSERSVATMTVGLFIAGGLAALIDRGPSVAFGAALVVAVGLAAALLSRRAAVVAVTISVLSTALYASLVTFGVVPPPVASPTVTGLDWVRVASIIAICTVVLGVLVSSLTDGLSASLTQSEALVTTLREEVASKNKALADLEASRQQLERSAQMALVGRLAGGVAHDMNNLLTVMTLEAEALGEEGELLKDASRTASRMTRELVTLAKGGVSAAETVDLSVVIERDCQLARRGLPEGIELRFHEATTPAWVRADVDQLQQVLLNCVFNARDAIGPEGVIDVRVEAGAEGIHTLTIVDNGPGMDASTVASVFSPFFTTKDHGTGLGMANVKAIADRHGGEVQLTSSPGQGASVSLTLPAAAEPPVVAEASPTLDGEVLVVDDDDTVRASLVRELRALGAVAREVDNAEDALRYEGDAMLVITDLVLPGGGGKVIDHFEQRGTPLLVCSGYTDDEALASRLREGRHVVLPKPFTGDQLRRAVVRALGGSSHPPEPPGEVRT